MIRLDCCNNNPETTVLTHLNGGGSGKNDDFTAGAWGCSACHRWVDYEYVQEVTTPYRDLYHLQAVRRTQEALMAAGLGEVIKRWARGLKL
jgi:hypothetical protein